MVFNKWTATVILLPLLVSVSSHYTQAKMLQVTWLSPADGDVYSPGSFLVGRWTANVQVISPTFKLCSIDQGEDDYSDTTELDQDDCGVSVQPSVQSSHSRFYEITLCVLRLIGQLFAN
jgi:hypothetical protein